MQHEHRYKFAVGFVIYNPEASFLGRLSLLNDLGVAVYIFDNSPENTKTKSLITSLKNVMYATAGKNLGLGSGISVVTATAFYSQFEMMLFLDQDTAITKNTIGFINDFVVKHGGEYVANYLLILFQQLSNREEGLLVRDVELAISSGSLFYLSNLRLIGWHNESYFVDGVDYEICLRARRFGFKIGVFGGTPGFDHSEEQPDQKAVFFKKEFLTRPYTVRRIQDALIAYARLIGYAARHCDLKMLGIMLRSCLIYILGQIIARVNILTKWI